MQSKELFVRLGEAMMPRKEISIRSPIFVLHFYLKNHRFQANYFLPSLKIVPNPWYAQTLGGAKINLISNDFLWGPSYKALSKKGGPCIFNIEDLTPLI